jgi:hypothetical protein
LGFVAQELQTVFPQSVHKEPTSGYYGISMMDLIPVLVQAIKEQQTMIEDLQKKANAKGNVKSTISTDTVSALEASDLLEEADTYKTTKSTETKESSAISDNLVNNVDEPKLEQNIPNPFNSLTSINYFLPLNTHSAVIYIYDLQGMQKKSFKLTTPGSGSVAINGSELSAGMYYYTLVTDGKEIDTKRMILTQ